MKLTRLPLLSSCLFFLMGGAGCAPRNGHGDGDDDDQEDADGDADGDGDSDGDGDGDTDGDGDADSDADGDADFGPERCDDQVDNDRDGQVDEDCACELDATQACYTGPLDTRGHGACHDGQQDCADNVEFPSWGECVGEALPEDETCDDAIDNDCDGRTDEGCGEPDCDAPEFSEEQDCEDGVDDDCDELVDCDDPDCADECGDCDHAEDCDNDLDDDCNGLTDCGDPACHCGTDEVCDGVDNNDDGRIDEGRACGDAGDGDGACPPGAFRICDAYCGVHQLCSAAGAWGACLVDSSCAAVPECDQHTDCARGEYCDYGSCSPGTLSFSPCEDDTDCEGGFGGLFGLTYTCQVDQGVCIADCYHHDDCGAGLVCDLGQCVEDPYEPGQC